MELKKRRGQTGDLAMRAIRLPHDLEVRSLVSRRAILQMGACLACVSGKPAVAETRYGCTLQGGEMAQYMSPSNYEMPYWGSVPVVETGRLRGSGDSAFDRALAMTLVKISDIFSVEPGFAFSELVKLNAFASSNKSLGRDDGSVMFGNSLYREIMQRREYPEVGVVAVCAHEFGHIVQYRHGIDKILVSNGRVKRLELHADFLAGYFAGRRKLERPDFPAAVFASTQYSFGDSDYGNAKHHGTQTERGAAVVAGYESAYRSRQNFADALQTGIQYVSSIAW